MDQNFEFDIDLSDLQIPDINQIREFNELLQKLNRDAARLEDLPDEVVLPERGLHNEQWLAVPTADIPGAMWDADNECLTPGQGEVNFVYCSGENIQKIEKSYTVPVNNMCSEVIPAMSSAACGESMITTGTETLTFDNECTEVCITGTITGAGSVTITSGANSVELMEGDDIDECLTLDGDVDVTSTNAIFELTLQGQSESPNFVFALQDTACCQWWILTCGGGGGTTEDITCSLLHSIHDVPNTPTNPPINYVPVYGSDGACSIVEVVECGRDATPPCTGCTGNTPTFYLLGVNGVSLSNSNPAPVNSFDIQPGSEKLFSRQSRCGFTGTIEYFLPGDDPVSDTPVQLTVSMMWDSNNDEWLMTAVAPGGVSLDFAAIPGPVDCLASRCFSYLGVGNDIDGYDFTGASFCIEPRETVI